MSDIAFELEEQLLPVLRSGDIGCCEQIIADKMAALPHSPFHIALDLSITNSLVEVAAHFDRFFRHEANRFDISAAFAEMNGFDINPGRWFFDVFAFRNYGGHSDYDWLSDWQSEYCEGMTITGLEQLQKVYASKTSHQQQFEDAREVCGLLVVTKFQDVVGKATEQMRELRFRLLATAHDYDFIFEVPANRLD